MVKLGEIQPEPERDSPSIAQWAGALGDDKVDEGVLPEGILFRFQVSITDEHIANPHTGAIGHAAHAEAWIADVEPRAQLELLRNVQGTIGDMIQKMLAELIGEHSIERLEGNWK